MERRALAIAAEQRERRPGDRARQHASDRASRVLVLAEEVADALTVARAELDERSLRRRVMHDELGVVLDADAAVDGTDQVVDLLARRMGKAKTLVERPDAANNVAAQEDRERDRAVPDVVARQSGSVRRPGPAIVASGQTAERRIVLEALRDTLQQVVGIRAVVVWERDEIGLEPRQCCVARVRQAARRGDALDARRSGEPIVAVLVDEEHAKVAMRLALQRFEQVTHLVRPADGRHDEVERERHGPYASAVPLVTVLLATHDDARYLREAVDSVLLQTERDLELVIVDDASSDETAEILGSVEDGRVRILRNDEQRGLAASLNRGLDESDSRYVARLDADDVALPQRLERQLARARDGGIAVVGSAVRDLDTNGARGRLHRMPETKAAVRWHAFFSSPFFHPAVLADREALGGLRYDTEFLESEDYDLWTRLLATGAEGVNLGEPLVLKRVHPGQASLQRGDVQRDFQRRVALREIGRAAPDVDAERAFDGDGRSTIELLRAFEQQQGRHAEVTRAVRRRLLRAGKVWWAWRA